MYHSIRFSVSCNCYILEGTWIPIDSRNHTYYKSWRARRHHDEPWPLPMDIDTSDNYRKKVKRTGNNGISYLRPRMSQSLKHVPPKETHTHSNNDPKSQLQVSQRMEAMRRSLQSSLSHRFCTRRPPRRARSGSMRGLTRRGRCPDWVWCRRLHGRPASAVRRRRQYVVLSRRAVVAKEVSRTTTGGGALQRRAKVRRRSCCMAEASRRR